MFVRTFASHLNFIQTTVAYLVVKGLKSIAANRKSCSGLHKLEGCQLVRLTAAKLELVIVRNSVASDPACIPSHQRARLAVFRLA